MDSSACDGAIHEFILEIFIDSVLCFKYKIDKIFFLAELTF